MGADLHARYDLSNDGCLRLSAHARHPLARCHRSSRRRRYARRGSRRHGACFDPDGEESSGSDKAYGVWITTAYDELVGDMELPLFVVAGGVIFLLLIACANVANLLLARATLREKELAICAAIGARTTRLVRQLLSESAWLALAGASVGLLRRREALHS